MYRGENLGFDDIKIVRTWLPLQKKTIWDIYVKIICEI